jgi:hypothetical protein
VHACGVRGHTPAGVSALQLRGAACGAAMGAGVRSLFARALGASEALRFVYAFLLFVPVVLCTLLFSAVGRLPLMMAMWRFFARGLGLASRVHGQQPPADKPAVWVSNHFNWFDWPVLQAAAPYQLCAIVKVSRCHAAHSASWQGAPCCRAFPQPVMLA